MTILLVACSKTKNPASGLLPARERYEGALFRKAAALADQRDWQLYVVSARYGVIKGDHLIADYDARVGRDATPLFRWPKGSGFWVGARAYFAEVPARFVPLTYWPGEKRPGYNGIIAQLGRLNILLEEGNDE